MDIIIKKAKPMGNSASVYVPKEWKNKKVVVRLLSSKELILDVLQPWMANIIGVYLYGSYARGDEQEDSDIDVLVVTNHKIKVDYSKPLDMVVITQDELELILKDDPIQLMPIVMESQPVVNEAYLEKLKTIKVNPRQYLKLVRENEKKLRTYKLMITDKVHLDAIVYSLMLRLRAIYLVNLLLSNKKYSTADFQKYITELGIERESYENLYKIYRCVRDNRELPEKVITLEEILQLYDLLGKENQKLERRLKNAKKE